VTTKARRLASIAEAAQYVGVTTKTIRNQIAAGELTGYRYGQRRVIRVYLVEIDALLETSRPARPEGLV
jgi:excisionase family DNA binding protein